MENTNSTPINAMLDSIVKLLVEHLTEEVIKNLPYFTDADAMLSQHANRLDGITALLDGMSKSLERLDARLDKVETINAQAMSRTDVKDMIDGELADYVTRSEVEDVVTDQLPDFDDLVNERLPDMDDYLQTSDLESELSNVTVPVSEDDVAEAVRGVLDGMLDKLRITRV